MEGIWDLRTDAVQEGDKLRDVSPITHKTRIDENGYTHYLFKGQLFKTPSYRIPEDDFKLFRMFLDGEALIYPSDGDIPLDIVAVEAKKVLNYIVTCSLNKENNYWENNLQWADPDNQIVLYDVVCTANNLNQLLDFVAENYFEGTKLR